jgi:hypothetical protein
MVLLSTVWSVPSGMVIDGAKLELTVTGRVNALRMTSPLATRWISAGFIVHDVTMPTTSRPTMSAAL